MTPTIPSILSSLAKPRLGEIAQSLGMSLPSGTKGAQTEYLASVLTGDWKDLLSCLVRDELKAACRAHELDDSGRDRTVLSQRLLNAAGRADVLAPRHFSGQAARRDVPVRGDVVRVRHRQYLVEEAVESSVPGQSPLMKLVCLDDDNQGRTLEVLWDLELGAQIIAPEAVGLGRIEGLDSPRAFAAYLHALKWNAVSATDANLFQSPFRAGIQLFDYQLSPLRKALQLPRANLFVADDVGLGKTIEAGLVLQELLLRQRVDYTAIVCPASVSLQWRDEMQQRFGLLFEVFSRAFLARRRQERGFAVNPWTTHNRFIISYQTLRRPEYRDPLLAHLGRRAAKSLLILDEAHTAAPASSQRFAIDSRVTRMVRDLAPRFENRLFLSATPHNGHSNSFSSLLHILDPQRFMRGVPVSGPEALSEVMVRRLKSDLQKLGAGQFPVRKVVEIGLRHGPEGWSSRVGDEAPTAFGPGQAPELELSTRLAEYTALTGPAKGAGRLVFINLQKRLLSSVAAFHRTLEVHRSRLDEAGPASEQLSLNVDEDASEYGLDEDTLEELGSAEVAQSTRALKSPIGRARELLEEMKQLADQHRAAPDAKARALVDWIQRNQCSAVRVGGAQGSKKERVWNDRRVIIFTEYGDTKTYLRDLLSRAVAGTEEDDDRILMLHGGMSDEQREEVQRAFNGAPDEYPVRILIATDAAREGVNLQGHCADLFHFDLPWNPSRLEQRNGRIDRTLQPSPEVRCHYFFYPQRPEDRVLQTIVTKVDVIQRELGSLGSVLVERLTEVMEHGIREGTEGAVAQALKPDARTKVVQEELERPRDLKRLKEEIEEAGRLLNNSREVMEFDPTLLQDAIDVGLELAGAGALKPLPAGAAGKGALDSFELPPMPESWQGTMDLLRPPRRRDELFWDWRKRAPQPVVFRPLARMNDGLVQLHLQHPFVQRILQRFRSQGFSAHDLNRVTVVRNRHDSLARVIAFGRLSLFGRGATRLHDRLVSVAAQWVDGKAGPQLKPFGDKADRKAIEQLEEILRESGRVDDIGATVRAKLQASAAGDFAALWKHIEHEAEEERIASERKLVARGTVEADAMRALLVSQRQSIHAELHEPRQLKLALNEGSDIEREQAFQEKKAMEDRLPAIEDELVREPEAIRALYRVELRRLEPVGLVYLWPETRG